MAKYALCIGITDYPGTGSDLSGCVNDANDWTALFQRRAFLTFELFDRQANGKNIRTAIESTIGGLLLAEYRDHQYSYKAYSKGRPNGAIPFVAIRVLAKLLQSATCTAWHKAIRKALPSSNTHNHRTCSAPKACRPGRCFDLRCNSRVII